MAKTPTPVADAASAVTITAAITLTTPLPARPARSGNSKYPFETLTSIGMVFGVIGRQAKNLNSVIASANKKARVAKTNEQGQPLFETMPGPAGTVVPDTSKPLFEQTAKYAVREVTPEIAAIIKGTALEGATALVERTA